MALALTAQRTDLDVQLRLLREIPAQGWAWIAVACGFQLASLTGRAFRWHFLFATPRPPTRRLFSALTIGYLANNLVARSGEFVRMWLVGRRVPELGFFGVAVTVTAERLLDVLMILSLAVTLMLISDLTAMDLVASEAALRTLMVAASLAATGVLAAVRYGQALATFASTLMHRLPERAARILGPFSERVFAGLSTLRRSGLRGLTLVLVLCALDWFWVMLCHRTAGLAFGVSLTTLEVCFIMVAAGLGAMIPAGPGNVGAMVPLMQLAAEQTAMRHAALAYSVTMFSVYYVVRSIAGLIALAGEDRE